MLLFLQNSQDSLLYLPNTELFYRHPWIQSSVLGSDLLNTLLLKVEVEYADGTKFKFSSEFLRIHSPAADGKVRSIGGEKVISGRRYVGIMSAEPVGNYGVRLVFDDLHRTGIYPWDYFHELGSNKFGLMRSYIKTLQKHNLSREPAPSRKR
ncbi:PREDICTED: uncharacterized protein LOC104779965 isoform X1 [Camelina sativa]|uniref:Uncharacterized protein LOC104779965 isoform X1 n=1 Tax=Camelina sativa TaxID=90675 RepID=A0ABM0YL75_CAMSA|nr:PREDICTED: uncharacterized protein LOC104779965 isoform X1 [Camelina sativa]